MNTLRFGCIGCGGMGRLHVLNAKYVPGMEVVAFADPAADKAQKFLENYGGEYATAFSGPDFSPTGQGEHFKDVRGPHGYTGHYDELVALCEAIRNDTEPPMTVEEGRHVLQVEKAIRESVQTGQVIDYPQFLARWGTSQPLR
jgi:predicted dehydrogenase